jgi:hypothetical protein
MESTVSIFMSSETLKTVVHLPVLIIIQGAITMVVLKTINGILGI